MSNYVLQLNNKLYSKNISLELKDEFDFFDAYLNKESDEYVHNDYAFFVSVVDVNGTHVNIDSLFVNNEAVDNQFLNGKKPTYMFLECFGVVRIEVIIDGSAYITPNLRVVMKEKFVNSSIVNMIDYIYNNCDDYLYEEHKHSKIATGIRANANVSVDAKLSMLNDIYDTYTKGYGILKYNAQTKLIPTNRVGDFTELQSVGRNTIDYIVNHPEELQPVAYNSGITVNKQYYQPQKTLVQSVKYSFDTYENQVVVSFLKSVIHDLESIRQCVVLQKKRNKTPYMKDGYIDSSFYIYTRNVKMLDDYLKSINFSIERFQKMYIEYKSILNVTEIDLVSLPKYTNVFRQIMPYNIIFEKITNWFNSGDYDLAKSNLLLTFVSTSKIYEYFCLLKINDSVKNCGYTFVKGYSFRYKENKYYRNTLYNNSFEYIKGDIHLTVYYQPIIYGKIDTRDRPNGIGLFRNTTISIKDPSVLAMLDDSPAPHGNYYVPDYLIRISKNDVTNYYILDAKHSSINNVERFLLPHLTFKYLFSISTFPQGKNVSGMCVLCGKSSSNATKSIYDVAEALKISLTPNATIFQLSGNDTSDNEDLIEYIQNIEKQL